ncbi:hypothetical protein ACFVWL_10240 [Microbacterium sp. NPDC058269]|uniref:hypothetical protein n=1 Tax=Microbacterium sp. NPDC058269 TaxID=3346414 RepID=UPI0036DE365D
MANLEVRIRHVDEADALPFAEIPFRREAIDGVLNLIYSTGGNLFGLSLSDEVDLSMQFAEDGEKGYLEVIVEQPTTE